MVPLSPQCYMALTQHAVQLSLLHCSAQMAGRKWPSRKEPNIVPNNKPAIERTECIECNNMCVPARELAETHVPNEGYLHEDGTCAWACPVLSCLLILSRLHHKMKQLKYLYVWIFMEFS